MTDCSCPGETGLLLVLLLMGKSSSVKVLCLVQGFSYAGVDRVVFIVHEKEATKARNRHKKKGQGIISCARLSYI